MPTLSLSTPRCGQIAFAALLSAAAIIGLWQFFAMSPESPNPVLDLLASTGIVSSHSVDLQWYPPSDTQINNLTFVLGGEGHDGFIFNSSKTPDDKYGTYNWCNMPHARAKEYTKTPEDYQLVYVEVVSQPNELASYKLTSCNPDSTPSQTYALCCECLPS